MNTTVTGYEPRFDIDLRRGQVGEQQTLNVIDALQQGRVEVKTDYGVGITGNFYIEFEKQNRQGEWVPSGLGVTEADWWAFAYADGVIFVATETLKRLAREYWRSGHVGQRNGNEHSSASRGVKLPVADLVASMEPYS